MWKTTEIIKKFVKYYTGNACNLSLTMLYSTRKIMFA